MTKNTRDEQSSVAKNDDSQDNSTTRNPKRARSSPSDTENKKLKSPAEAAADNVNRQTLGARRGDIRMHKAVAARLADPFLSPFEALKIGGFDYPSDNEEPTALDSDKVTLGQRKNQLSRRLRLAKKQGEEPPSGSSSSSSSKVHDHHDHEKDDQSTPSVVSEEEGAAASTSCSHSHKHSHHHKHASSPTKRKDDTDTSTTTESSSSAAMASLMASARATGMTLDQLAEAVAANRTFLSTSQSSLSSTKTTIPKHEKTALKLHQIESKALYDKSLVLAGADVDKDYAPNSQAHLAFCYHAWQVEGKRLRTIMEENHHANNDHHEYQSSSKKKRGHGNQNHHHKKASSSTPLSKHHHHHHTKGLHIHRLDGQCGHKAIIHHPKDGVPHIDFIVGDVVECYHGVNPAPENRVIQWQSKYTCGEMDCPPDCGRSRTSASTAEDAIVAEPKDDAATATPIIPTQDSHNHHHHNHHGSAEDNTTAAATPCDHHQDHEHDHHDHEHEHHHHDHQEATTSTTTCNNNNTTIPSTQAATAEPKSIPIRTINENDPEWNFDPDESMDDLLSGLLLHG